MLSRIKLWIWFSLPIQLRQSVDHCFRNMQGSGIVCLS
ncbi:hypothetical protein ZOSMA_64G00600 [Zostera marina]|uniref:Uncharacterized protein n=1 Tax=Zostera marina TaxID=29655 RepID=A0A0K9NT79_ZOSMR|nr:hypothetical protein ZOSMA_64G00600 [Zostera marina]